TGSAGVRPESSASGCSGSTRGCAYPDLRKRARPSWLQFLRIDDRELGDRQDELAAPGGDVAHLLDDLVLEIPRQDQDVVGLARVDRLDLVDRDVHARREASVLVRIAIDGEFHEVSADAAIVQQRVALPGSAVAADDLALVLRLDQERQESALGPLHPLAERRVGREVLEPEGALAGEKGRDALGDRSPRG